MEPDSLLRQTSAAAVHPILRSAPRTAPSKKYNAAPRSLHARKSLREWDRQSPLETTVLSVAVSLQTRRPDSKPSPAARSLQSPFVLQMSAAAVPRRARSRTKPESSKSRSKASPASASVASDALESYNPASHPAPTA